MYHLTLNNSFSRSTLEFSLSIFLCSNFTQWTHSFLITLSEWTISTSLVFYNIKSFLNIRESSSLNGQILNDTIGASSTIWCIFPAFVILAEELQKFEEKSIWKGPNRQIFIFWKPSDIIHEKFMCKAFQVFFIVPKTNPRKI